MKCFSQDVIARGGERGKQDRSCEPYGAKRTFRSTRDKFDSRQNFFRAAGLPFDDLLNLPIRRNVAKIDRAVDEKNVVVLRCIGGIGLGSVDPERLDGHAAIRAHAVAKNVTRSGREADDDRISLRRSEQALLQVRRQIRVYGEFTLQNAMAFGVRLAQGVTMRVEDFLVDTRDGGKDVAGERVFVRLFDFH